MDSPSVFYRAGWKWRRLRKEGAGGELEVCVHRTELRTECCQYLTRFSLDLDISSIQ